MYFLSGVALIAIFIYALIKRAQDDHCRSCWEWSIEHYGEGFVCPFDCDLNPDRVED